MKYRITTQLVKSLQPRKQPYEIVDFDLKGFLLRIQPSGAMSYYYSYRTEDGKRTRRLIGPTTNIKAPEARRTAEQYSADVIKGVDVQNDKKEKRKRRIASKARLLKNFLDLHYEPWVTQHRKTGNATMAKLRSAFDCFMNIAIEDISVRKIENWRNSRLSGGNQKATVNRLVATLRAVLSKAVEWDFLEHHPLAKLKPLRCDRTPRDRFLTPDEVMRLFDAVKARDEELKKGRDSGNQFRTIRNYPLLPDLRMHEYADRMIPLITLALKTGLRKGELFSLTWPDVNFTQKVVTVRAENAKSSKARYVPLSVTAFDVLNNWYEQRNPEYEYVFPSTEGGALDNVKKSWATILSTAKIKDFRWHDMRHDFASKLVMEGAPLNTVRELCGHADLNTTLRYAHLAPDHKADAIALLG